MAKGLASAMKSEMKLLFPQVQYQTLVAVISVRDHGGMDMLENKGCCLMQVMGSVKKKKSEREC